SVQSVALSEVVGSRILAQHLQNYRICSDAPRIQRLGIDRLHRPRSVPEPQESGLERVGWHYAACRRRAYVAAALIEHEEERLVLEYRAASRSPKAVVDQEGLGQPYPVVGP